MSDLSSCLLSPHRCRSLSCISFPATAFLTKTYLLSVSLLCLYNSPIPNTKHAFPAFATRCHVQVTPASIATPSGVRHAFCIACKAHDARRTPAKTNVAAPRQFFKALSLPLRSVQFRSVPFGFRRFHSVRLNSVPTLPLHSVRFYSVPLASLPFHSFFSIGSIR